MPDVPDHLNLTGLVELGHRQHYDAEADFLEEHFDL